MFVDKQDAVGFVVLVLLTGGSHGEGLSVFLHFLEGLFGVALAFEFLRTSSKCVLGRTSRQWCWIAHSPA